MSIAISDTDIGWLAGILDGEGSVTLMKRYGPNANRHRTPHLSITSTDIEILERVRLLIGGAINKIKKYKPGMKQAWIWSRTGGQVILEVCALLEPFMSCPKKKRRIRFLLSDYAATRKLNGRYTSEERSLKEAFETRFFEL